MDKQDLLLYRKRVIPDECILLKDDNILRLDGDMIVTSWKALQPKLQFSHGCSCYYLNRGFKISRFYRQDGTLLYWYCDIVEYQMQPDGRSLVVLDLLADVIITPEGKIRILDLDELAEAYNKSLITREQLLSSLCSLNSLLRELDDNGVDTLDRPLKDIPHQ